MTIGIKEEKKKRKREILEMQEAIRACGQLSDEIKPGPFVLNEKWRCALGIKSKAWPRVSSQLEAIFGTRFVPKVRKYNNFFFPELVINSCKLNLCTQKHESLLIILYGL